MRRYESANEWPEWTDEDRFELGPDPDDAAWASQSFGEDDGLMADVEYDRAAGESAALDRYEAGLA